VDENTTVVGVDGSQPAHAAVRWAANRAERRGGDLLLVHVVPGPDASDEGHELLERAREIAAANAPSARILTDLLVGDPVWALGEGYAAVREIVVGSHKTGFLRGFSFGSRSLQLASVAAAPVIVVPGTGDPSASGVVVGIDESADGLAALDFAVRHASESGQELVVTRCVPASRGDGRRHVDPDEVFATSALDRARRRVSELAPDLRVRSRVVHGTPAQALVRASTHASLVVLGRSQGTESTSPIGRVTHDVLLNLSGATAVVAAAGGHTGVIPARS
jgi:nucleotide-binding universal stress UspA family protein